MAAIPFRVKAVFDYASGHDDDLKFDNGQIITVTDVEDDDWYFGEYEGAEGAKKQGLFPKNFVEKYEPVTPPRPSRPAKREPEQEREAHELESAASTSQATSSAAPTNPVELPSTQDDGTEDEDDEEDSDSAPAAPVTSSAVPVRSDPQQSRELPVRSAISADNEAANAPAVEQNTRPVPPPPSVSKSPPPPVSDKPAASSFRDRIAAFNKPAAAPVAPAKPGQMQGSSFVKKPFVPPPPSRNAYVPIPKEAQPPKVYRREEDPTLPEPVSENTDPVNPLLASEDGGDDLPKPTSLKERIALLQKQQLEQAARHADAAAKKEKPKKPPPRKRPETSAEPDETAAATVPEQSLSETEDEDAAAAPRPSRVSRSKDRTPIASPNSTQNAFLSDPNDADQSAGGETEDGEPFVERRTARAPNHRPLPPIRQQSDARDDEEGPADIEQRQAESVVEEKPEDEGEEAEDEEEEEMDPEIRRRMEIRERMAKMSGGMGMAGMFGPPGGLPPLGPRKTRPSANSSRDQEDEQTSSLPGQPVPIMALPGMAMPGLTRVKSPQDEEDSPARRSLQASDNRNDQSEDEKGEAPAVPSRDVPQPPNARSVPAPPTSRDVPPVPSAPSAAAQQPPSLPESRPPPPAPPVHSQILSAGEESDDEMSGFQDVETPNRASFEGRRPPPPPVPSNAPPPGTETAPISPTSPASPSIAKSSTFPQSTTASEKRMSRQPPPIPTAAPPTMSPPSAIRGPPPPPPPPTRDSMDNNRPSRTIAADEDSEEVTEYEGDYDTDIAAGDGHKDALTADQGSSADETITGDESTYHHSGLPSLGPLPGMPPPGASAPRAAPPPPPPREPPRTNRPSSEFARSPPPAPTQAPNRARPSNDIPRSVPPPVPQSPPQNADYDPFRYDSRPSLQTSRSQKSVTTVKPEPREDDNLYSSSPPRITRAPPPEPPNLAPPPPTSMPPISTTTTRQSLDVNRPSLGRPSLDGRPSMDHGAGFIASEIDVGRSSLWWSQRKMPPPALQNRTDVAFEIEDSTAIQQGGPEMTLKHIYVLFMDYSQTVLTAQFPQADPSKVEFNQRYEAPPVQLRQDQLEAAHSNFGTRIAEMANQKVNQTIGNGTPIAFVTELLHSLPDAIPAVGTRAFGAVVYANMANASVQQLDEIRTGDIISFRNAKLQGHKGPMKQKYNIDVGKPDHIAVVVDWDGTKKKIRAWEQGRESKKVKIESFKLGDLKSGEIKIWRVVGREWVGWGNKS